MEPKKLFEFFDEICRIPRESGHEQGMTQYLVSFARSRGLNYREDAIGNVVISKPATSGMENRKGVVIQSHTDMVCEKLPGVEHNFGKDPILYYEEDGWLKAKGTTLGADDGIGVAAALAVLDSGDLQHGPLECLFTVSEETGLDGARAVESDYLKASVLLNLDNEDDGEFCIGCAGGVDTTATFSYKEVAVPENFVSFEVSIEGLSGGHSGDDIDKGRANANQLLARFLYLADGKCRYFLNSINGGGKRNAIARDAKAVISFGPTRAHTLRKLFETCVNEWKAEYRRSEPLMEAHFAQCEKAATAIDSLTARKLIGSLYSCPHGVLAMSMEIKGLVETSSNLASIRMEPNCKIVVATNQRSAVNSARANAARRIESLFTLAGAKVEHHGEYPGWEPNADSPIARLAAETYRRLFGTEPVVRAIHAGLECGLLSGVFPKMDMVSFGPTMRGVHSPDERLELSTVAKFWELLVTILKEVK